MGAITKFVKGSFLDKNYVCCRTKTFHNVKVRRLKKDFSKNHPSTHNLTRPVRKPPTRVIIPSVATKKVFDLSFLPSEPKQD